ncbi:MAG: ABC transporter permease [Chloroflexi bacterium]|nr:ABC transporter permease [Chloroflexota bacterium]
MVDWDWIFGHLDDIGEALSEHLLLTGLAVGVGFALSFAAALVIHRRRALYGPITAFAGIVYTIPSLALLAFLVPLTGLSVLTAEIALVSYTLLILIRNIMAGLDSVPPEMREAADGMGYTQWQRLWRVEFPLALPVIVAGLRVATVTTIGLVTVTALIGQGGLGGLMIRGFIRQFDTLIYVGAVLSVLLAIIADLALLLVQRAITPWTRMRTG